MADDRAVPRGVPDVLLPYYPPATNPAPGHPSGGETTPTPAPTSSSNPLSGASAAALGYYNTFDAGYKAMVLQSLSSSGNTLNDWFNNSVAAGDPGALNFAGVRLPGGGTGDIYGGNVATGGEPSSAWLGKRKPTPAELRAWAVNNSEDFLRFDDRQLAAWIASGWDVAAGGFRNEAGDLVGKPTDSGPLSQAKGWATGEASTAGYWNGQGGAAPTATTASPLTQTSTDLGENLYNMFSTRGGYFTDDPTTTADDNLQGRQVGLGGLWWGPTGFMSGETPVAPAAAQVAPAQSAQPQGQQNQNSIPMPQIPAGPFNPPNEGVGVELNPQNVQASPLTDAILSLYPRGTRQWWREDSNYPLAY